MNRRYNYFKWKACLFFLLSGFILITIPSPAQCESINQADLIMGNQLLIDQSLFLVIINPGAKKQLSNEQNWTNKEKRKALRKYYKSLKKDLKANKNVGAKDYLEAQKKTDAVAIILLVFFGIFLLGLLIFAVIIPFEL